MSTLTAPQMTRQAFQSLSKVAPLHVVVFWYIFIFVLIYIYTHYPNRAEVPRGSPNVICLVAWIFSHLRCEVKNCSRACILCFVLILLLFLLLLQLYRVEKETTITFGLKEFASILNFCTSLQNPICIIYFRYVLFCFCLWCLTVVFVHVTSNNHTAVIFLEAGGKPILISNTENNASDIDGVTAKLVMATVEPDAILLPHATLWQSTWHVIRWQQTRLSVY